MMGGCFLVMLLYSLLLKCFANCATIMLCREGPSRSLAFLKKTGRHDLFVKILLQELPQSCSAVKAAPFCRLASMKLLAHPVCLSLECFANCTTIMLCREGPSCSFAPPKTLLAFL